jgi:predicted dehydrogenase
MKFLVIGLGSMGKRRIRCLKKLGHKNIYGFDASLDRAKQVSNIYKVKTYNNFKEVVKIANPNIFIISTPPDKHYSYARFAVKNRIPCFMEASVETYNNALKLSNFEKKRNGMIFPSCTMKYFYTPRILDHLIKKKAIGKVLNFNYQVGQYLPDWHPWENIKNFYVSKKKTGACREIVPFELNWICSIFGFPKVLNSYIGKISKLNMQADDIYHFILKFPKNIIANITIEVLSRGGPTRNMTILGSNGKIYLNYEDKTIKLYSKNKIKKIFHINEGGKSYKGYVNSEKPYVNEMSDFIKAVLNKKKKLFPNNLIYDANILRILEKIER